MSDDYPSLSPFAYCANNPVMLVDPDGEKIKIYYQAKDGKTKTWVFNGRNQNRAPKNAFILYFLMAYNYNAINGGGSSLIALVESQETVSLYQTNGISQSIGGYAILWNPNCATLTSDNIVLSPSTNLEEEATHYLNWLYDYTDWKKRRESSDPSYGNLEEKDAKTHTAKTATANGEASNGWVEGDHNGTPIGVWWPTSNKPTTASNKYLYKMLNTGIYDYSKMEEKTNEFLKD